MSTRLTTSEFAQVAGISERKARRAFARALQGKPWRGVYLEVEPLHGRGGERGLSYVVRASSLPAELQQHFNAPANHDVQAIEGPSAEATRRLNVIAPIIAHKPKTPERRAAFKMVLASRVIGADCKAGAVPESTIRRWVKEYDREGVAGVRRKVRSDKGTPRVVISKAWFEAVAPLFDAATIERIDVSLCTYVRTMLAAGESPKRTIFRAGMKLQELTAAAGYAPAARRTFTVPRHYVGEQRLWRKVATRNRDAKAWHDMRPAIRRQLAARPTEFSIDVMHFDHVVLREDGTMAYPKGVVWMCHATNRLRVDIYLLDQREGMRQDHIADSIERGFAEWGVPERLTIDNGSEFKHVHDLADIVQLAAQVRSTDGHAPLVMIGNARPYGARSKPVENGIGVLQRVWLASIPGHVGNNRLNRKTQQVGKLTLPFPGTFEEFCTVVQLRVREYNAASQRGRLKGRSPDEAFRAHVEAGFKVAMVDRASLLIAFSKRDVAAVGKFGIRVQGRYWTCAELHYRSGEKIGVLKGRFRNWPVVPLFDLADPNVIIGYAEPHDAVDGNDPANAKEGGRRVARFNARAREIAAIAPPADLIADTIASAASLPPPAMAPIAGTIIPNPQAAEIVAAMVEDTDTREQRRRAKVSRDAQRQLAVFEKFAPKRGSP